MHSTAGGALRLLPFTVLIVALAAVGCASDSEGSAAPISADATEFPEPDGRTLEEIAEPMGESELVVSPAVSIYRKGTNRLGFGVFTLGREPVADAEVAIYAARPDKPAVGPFPATSDPIEPAAAFRSKSTSTDPDAAERIYTAEVELDGKGEWRLLAVVNGPDGPTATNLPSATVGRSNDVPRVGEKAPMIHTPTPEDVGGDLTKIDTRQPPSTLHEDDFADVVGSEPVVLLFATPALCTSRVCGPVTDLTEEVKAERPDDASYIMMEIYKDNVLDEGLREQVEAYSLPTEPWLFVVDTDGKISTAIEGAFSKRELESAIDKAS